jgi:hypothetical protein
MEYSYLLAAAANCEHMAQRYLDAVSSFFSASDWFPRLETSLSRHSSMRICSKRDQFLEVTGSCSVGHAVIQPNSFPDRDQVPKVTAFPDPESARFQDCRLYQALVCHDQPKR